MDRKLLIGFREAMVQRTRVRYKKRRSRRKSFKRRRPTRIIRIECIDALHVQCKNRCDGQRLCYYIENL